MKERPILFSAPMIRALLDGTKTQTRRALKSQPLGELLSLLERPIRKDGDLEVLRAWFQAGPGEQTSVEVTCPYGKPGDRLWVRESLKAVYDANEKIADYAYAADSAKVARCPELDTPFSDGMAFAHLARPGGVPSIHMPRWASRILLEVTDVRVERLQAISRGDAMAEGCPFANMAKSHDPRWWFAELWREINSAGAWDANPWCWAISFKRITA